MMGKNQKGIKHVEYLGLLEFERLNSEIYININLWLLIILFCSRRTKEQTVCLVALHKIKAKNGTW